MYLYYPHIESTTINEGTFKRKSINYSAILGYKLKETFMIHGCMEIGNNYTIKSWGKDESQHFKLLIYLP